MFISLVSGSSGNASIIKNNNTTILLDCGLSGKKLSMTLDSIGMSCDEIDAMLITHEHTDHTQGAGVVSRRFNIPIYATEKTHLAMSVGPLKEENIKIIKSDEPFEIGTIGITPFSISHDASDPVCYSFLVDNKKYSIATDTGIMTDKIFNSIAGSDFLMLEANHDIDMLMYGDYPYDLKKRIMSNWGHLSNNLAAENAIKLLENNTHHIMLSHLSEKNNDPNVAYKTVENALTAHGAKIGKDISLCVAKRYEVTNFS